MATHDQPDPITPLPQVTRLETMLNSRRARQRVTLADLEDAVTVARELAARLAETEETTARWAQYLAPTREALGARDWPSLPETARALAAEQDQLRARVAELEHQPSRPPVCGREGATGRPCPDHAPSADVIELTWRAQDVEIGDDDSADLMLTTEDGRPAILRLDPDQRRALLDDLANAGTVTEYGVRFPTRDPDFVVSADRATAERDIARAARHGLRAELVVRIVRYGDWQSADVEDGGDDQ
ncbi:hypothetical protein [Streptomyces sp. MP131-18]|uniref:hypothetical protein n=1 Tax=Streptomyces sp. MP131-18 TaxID=1857892 RepID=UPI00097BC524|nr:hypothetical protein [Streptomyces sp. MP131-18]ONK13097.1 hypothetical protein STBA_38590 [Streptomyces sp. MP131-18]